MADTAVKRVRTCVGCKQQSGKTSLVRIVRASDGSVALDATGRVPGRGAYVCSLDCLSQALSKRTLQRALKCEVGNEASQRLMADMAALSAASR